MKTMTQVLAALVSGPAALLVVLAPSASASTWVFTTSQDAQYVAGVHNAGIYSSDGDIGLIMVGHQIVNDVYDGVRTPAQEQVYVYTQTPLAVGRYQANQLVNYALYVYLGVPQP